MSSSAQRRRNGSASGHPSHAEEEDGSPRGQSETPTQPKDAKSRLPPSLPQIKFQILQNAHQGHDDEGKLEPSGMAGRAMVEGGPRSKLT